VIPSFDAPTIAQALSRRKSAIVNVDGSETPAVVSYGTVSPEQAFVSFSSTCFSTFVKYFYDYLMYLEDCGKKRTHPDRTCIAGFDTVAEELKANHASMHSGDSRLMEGPPHSENKVLSMLDEAGKRLVNERLVDSFFGNISCFYEDSIYISETASSLDELPGNIDFVPVDGSSSAGITSSSEYSTHRSIYMNRDVRFILHGHPRLSVIMSMVCLRDCELSGQCHRLCREKRDLFGVPVVPGEIGTGPTGIVHTVPKALQTNDAVIVFGHGVFTAGRNDFNGPFARMKEIEKACRDEYFRRAAELTVR
jgi:ribulose-5-phosphate 4-epimerase/fuculose-1-phosphate aldolase